jgi:lipopolysaccharide transport system ATP-binding protein
LPTSFDGYSFRMSDFAIRAENLGKQYQLGAAEGQFRYRTAREAIAESLSAPLRWLGRGTAPPERIWALQDVSFQVAPGEVVGVIGRNGAGKSTLLKVLSRITHPTTGRVRLKGRMASLLEVGTGFHPELSGRENIFLNGAILGMTRREIERKFDEIVAFSEVEKFVDTPVKRYSSGMYLRLAFAVAAHLEPEILVVDEVLAVGDVGFQKKCLGKMDDVARQGRTVLFVSHNMEAVRNLTQTGLYLSGGRVVFHGTSNEAISTYLRDQIEAAGGADVTVDAYRRPRADNEPVTLRAIEVNGATGTKVVGMCEDVTLRLLVSANEDVSEARCTIVVRNDGGQIVTRLFSTDYDNKVSLRRGDNELVCHIPRHPFPPGRYSVDIGIKPGYSNKARAWDVIRGYPCLSVVLGPEGEALGWPDRPWGVVHLPGSSWQYQPLLETS